MTESSKPSPFIEVQARHGVFRTFQNDVPVGKSLRNYGEWAENELSFLLKLLKDGDVVLDIGANIGTHSIPFANQVSPKGRCIAVEPQGEVFNILSWNAARNCNESNIQLLNVAAGAAEDTVYIPQTESSEEFNFGGVTLSKSANSKASIPVKQITLDSLHLDQCRLLKIDTEGFEINVLQGATDLIHRFKPFIYLECNEFEKAAEICKFLKPLGYQSVYLEAKAFNEDNHFKSSDNFLGYAHESSLFFIPQGIALELKPQKGIKLSYFSNESELESIFLKTIRSGDLPQFPTQLEIKKLRKSHQLESMDDSLRQPIVALVNISKLSELERFSKTLTSSIPLPVGGLSFLLIESIAELIHSNSELVPILKRPDVFVLKKGDEDDLMRFWLALAAVRGEVQQSDIVMIDPSVLFSGEIFSTLQQEAHLFPDTATLLPLPFESFLSTSKDRCFNKTLSLQHISHSVKDLQSIVSIRERKDEPDFCLFVRGDAFSQIGYTDQLFRQAGERQAWYQVAEEKKWKNRISTQITVKNPSTLESTSQFVGTNSFYEVTVLIHAVQQDPEVKGTYLYALHADTIPRQGTPGGTERHVAAVRGGLLQRSYFVLELFPESAYQMCLRGFLKDEVIFERKFHTEMISSLLQLLSAQVEVLHIHHLLNWVESAVRSLQEVKFQKKIISAHDFFLLCPSINLLKNPDRRTFCEVEMDIDACNQCLVQWVNDESATIQAYRSTVMGLFESSDLIIFPSKALLSYFEKALAAKWNKFAPKVSTVGHDLSHLFSIADELQKFPDAPVDPNLVAVIGAMLPLKGSMELLESLPALQNLGFKVEILGLIIPSEHPNLNKTKVIPYKDVKELTELLRQRRPAYICTPSITAESFCFAFFEGLILTPGSVPVVGPFGNPAEVVKTHRIGSVMQGTKAKDLVESLVDAREKRQEYLKHKSLFVQSLRNEAKDYIENYLTLSRVQSASSRLISRIEATVNTLGGLEELQQAQKRFREKDEREMKLNANAATPLPQSPPSVIRKVAKRLPSPIKKILKSLKHRFETRMT